MRKGMIIVVPLCSIFMIAGSWMFLKRKRKGKGKEKRKEKKRGRWFQNDLINGIKGLGFLYAKTAKT